MILIRRDDGFDDSFSVFRCSVKSNRYPPHSSRLIYMTAILYGNGQSRSFRCVWALNEANIAFEYQGIDKASFSDAFLKVSPHIKVPAFTVGDLHMSESAAIVNYAGNVSKHTSLIPSDVERRAQYDDICYFVMTELEQPL